VIRTLDTMRDDETIKTDTDPLKALVTKAKTGDADAFDMLLDELLPSMLKQAMKVTGHLANAEDIVQEASLRIFRNLASFKGDSSVLTWATRITLNCCYDLFRREKTRQAVSLTVETDEGTLERTLPDPGDSPLDLLESAEVIAAVREAALALKEPYRTTLIEIDLLQHSYEEVSEKLDVPLGTIKSRLSRARKMAADILKKRLGTK